MILTSFPVMRSGYSVSMRKPRPWDRVQRSMERFIARDADRRSSLLGRTTFSVELAEDMGTRLACIAATAIRKPSQAESERALHNALRQHHTVVWRMQRE